MSDSDNYFSDSDKSLDNNQDDNLQEEDSDYEMDEETRRIIYNASLKSMEKSTFFSEDTVQKPKKVKPKKNKQREVKHLSFIDFQNKLEEEKPKKWKSSRSQNKKEELGITTKKIVKRRFNPRLPVPTIDTFKKIEDEDEITNSEENFPSLSASIVV